jgi:hypothetical protein
MKFDANIFSDLYKEAHGIRPHGFNPADYSADELDQIWSDTIAAAEASAEAQRLLQEQAKADFEKAIERTIVIGAKDRQTAINWLWEAVDPEKEDFDYFAYQNGLSVSDSFVYEKIAKGQE